MLAFGAWAQVVQRLFGSLCPIGPVNLIETSNFLDVKVHLHICVSQVLLCLFHFIEKYTKSSQ